MEKDVTSKVIEYFDSMKEAIKSKDLAKLNDLYGQAKSALKDKADDVKNNDDTQNLIKKLDETHSKFVSAIDYGGNKAEEVYESAKKYSADFADSIANMVSEEKSKIISRAESAKDQIKDIASKFIGK